MENAKVSVIMPAYNAGKYIEESIESVLKQTYENWILTIVNDGSQDNTKEIIEEYVKKYPDKIHMIDKKQNEGTVSGLNTLIREASGEYICWLSADDLYTEKMIEESYMYIQKHKSIDVVFANYDKIDQDTNYIGEAPFKKYIEEIKSGNDTEFYNALLTQECCIHGCTVFMKTDCYKTAGEFNPKYRYAHDYDMWLRVAANFNFGYIDSIHVRGREYTEQISRQGHNEVDAINVLFDFLKSHGFEMLYRKSGYSDYNVAVAGVVLGQLKKYKHRQKEFECLLKRTIEDEKICKSLQCTELGGSLLKALEIIKDQIWNLSENYFQDTGEENYLEMTCKVFEVDAVILNKPVIRFDKSEDKGLKKFNYGMMRSNDMYIGKVKKENMDVWLLEHAHEYRTCIKSDDESLSVAITYYMVKDTNIVDELQITDMHYTDKDMWWELFCYMYSLS